MVYYVHITYTYYIHVHVSILCMMYHYRSDSITLGCSPWTPTCRQDTLTGNVTQHTCNYSNTGNTCIGIQYTCNYSDTGNIYTMYVGWVMG